MSLTGEPKSIKNLRSGDLLIQCAKEKHETTLLNLKNFCGLKCKVTPHSSLNISKGIVRCPALNRQTCEHILEFMGEQGVTDVRRISVFRDGAKKLTNTFVFTFNSPVLPSVVKIGFMQVKVDVYIPNPLRCYQCQVFGHHGNKCSANSKQCPAWEKEKKILKIKCEQNISFPEARKQYEQFYDTRSYASAVKPGTCNKSTQTENKTTQTDDSFDEYLKKQEKPPSEKTPKETPKGKQDKNTSSPRPGPALKPATLEMIKKEEERKKKEEKDKLKNNKRKKENSNGKKNKHRKKKNKWRKQNKLKRIHILCLLKKMARRSWTMSLWFSQSHLPVITSLKAHDHDYH